ncbi:MAG: ABC transporter ATP-binding protein [Syntrophobacteraceae bacterium]
MLLETKGICKYFGGLKAVDEVDFTLQEGQLKSIIGPNGAGKTTFFNLVSGLFMPTKGSVLFQGRDISHKVMAERSQMGITKTFQITHIFPRLTVFENVRLAAQSRVCIYNFWRRAYRMKEINDRALELLEHVGLLEARSRPASELSHGEKKYLEIAIALATSPKVLLLDEPTAGMGPAETIEATRLIDILARELKLTIILIEHDMSVVMGISDEIMVLYEGRKLVEGTPAEINSNEMVQNVYLGKRA